LILSREFAPGSFPPRTMYAVEQDRAHPVPPPPPPLSMDRISAPSAAYPTPGSGPIRSSEHLAPISTIHEGRIWSLQVVQQPIRARMCGFGDKVGNSSHTTCDTLVLTCIFLIGSKTNHPAAMYPSHCTRRTHRKRDRYQVRTIQSRLTALSLADPLLVKSIPPSTC
jgi:hypothetical protein